MASVQAFNGVMDEFLSELQETFPKEKKLKVYYNGFLTMKKANPRKILELFMNNAVPHASLITKRDDALFKCENELIPDVDLSRLWNDDLDDETKDAIWQYINTLYVLGSTINSIPSSLLSTIEGVAEQCATQMSEEGNVATDDGKMPDMSALLAGMQNMLGNMSQERPKSAKKVKPSRK
tara:strand:- start:1745 stop:2284 length:540 start_codon:yes stop_codon:yes gene_type:complete